MRMRLDRMDTFGINHTLMPILSALLLALLFADALRAQTTVIYGPELACGAMDQGQLYPRIALNAAGAPVVLWGRNAPRANFVAVGGGASFSPAVMIHPMGVEPAAADWMGSSIAADGDDVWVALKATPEDTEGIYVVHSSDGGFTWGDTLRTDANDGTVARFPAITVVPGGEPVVGYMHFSSGWADAQHLARRMAGGAFQDAAPASAPFAPGDVCDCCPGQIVADTDHAVALYRNAGSNIRVIWGGVSTDGAASFGDGEPIDNTNWNINMCPSSGPDGYIAGDTVRAVWMSGAGGFNRIHMRSAHLPELTPGPPRYVHNAVPLSVIQNHPRIAGSGDTLGVVWQQYGGGNMAILFSHSVTGTSGLSVPDTVAIGSTSAIETPDIAYANGTFHIVWSSNTSGTVRYRSATLLNTTDVAESASSTWQVWPQPVGDLMHWAGIAASTCTLLDATGKAVVQVPGITCRLDVSRLAEGTYVLVATNAQGVTLAARRVLIAH